MDHKRRRSRALALTVVIVLAGLLAATPAVADRDAASEVVWGACPKDVTAAAPDLDVQCGTVRVPLDYAEPDGARINLMVSRLASDKPKKRRGVLLLNPGGPGGSALTMPATLVDLGIPSKVLDSYDLIGMDTRGFGRSAPIDCKFTVGQDYIGNIPPYAVDDAAVLAQAKIAKDVADQCAANDVDGRMAHITTANTARDLDRIRAALGEKKASFFGLSYGSALGAAYASMFPDTTDRILIDSNLGDTALDPAGIRRYALGMEQTFPDFAKWAAARHSSYGLGRTAREVRQTYFTLAQRLDEKPAYGLDGRQFRSVAFGSMFGERRYGQLAQLWEGIKDEDQPAVERLAAKLQTPSPSAGGASYSNSWSVFLTVTCNDVKWPSDVQTYQKNVAADRHRYPLFGAAAANILPCAFWRFGQSEPQVPINDEGPSNILIMQNRRDPVTPLLGGELFREKFPNRSRLVSVDGSGHGVYVFGRNACALNVGTEWLADGVMPKKDVTCRHD
ncbi:alpha/beta hydrolase [Streptomyces hygroscopicus]|uniref:alpha/beta hydrolase n=1 Tax=Streptomyces TaxID=1883 RepID=UPI00209D2BD4|nr:alpha/beta hydrolase [Streptomyces sp. RKCA744]MCO8308462.1 alpha/beta hydrolase [Streptomyces sp. RKCA744]